MTRTINVVEAASRVDVTFAGPVSFADRIDTMEEVGPKVAHLGLKGVVLDYTNAWVDESPVSAFEGLEHNIRACGWLEGMKVALVNPAEFHAFPTEGLSTEVGFEVRRFHTRSAAEAWLAKSTRAGLSASRESRGGRSQGRR